MKLVKVIIFAMFFVIPPLESVASAGSDEKEPRALTDKEMILLNSLINDDFNTFASGGKSLLKFNYINTTAKNIFSVYRKNQARGDNKFKGKNIIISGVVDSIKSGLGDIPYVVLDSNDMFEGVQITFSKNHRDLALDLDKGDEVKYACIGDGIIIGTPTLRNCKPISEAKDDIIRKWTEELKNIEDVKKENKKEILFVYFFVRGFGEISPQALNCKKNNEVCLKRFFKKDNMKDVADRTMEISKKIGVDLKGLIASLP